MSFSRPALFGLCVFATACWWSFAFLESAFLHAPLRVIGALSFGIACTPLRSGHRWNVRSFLDREAIVLAPFVLLTAFASVLAYAGPLALPPALDEAVADALLAKLYVSLGVAFLSIAVLFRAGVKRCW